MTDEERRTAINTVLKRLSFREREIVKLRYGLGDGFKYTHEEIAHIFKVSRYRIRSILEKAEKKLAVLIGD